MPFWQHCDLRDNLADTLLVNTNFTRDHNQETDILASLYMHADHDNVILQAQKREGQAKLQAPTNARFGKHMRIILFLLPIGSLAESRQRMAVVVRAKASRARLANRSVLPQLLTAAVAYSRR